MSDKKEETPRQKILMVMRWSTIGIFVEGKKKKKLQSKDFLVVTQEEYENGTKMTEVEQEKRSRVYNKHFNNAHPGYVYEVESVSEGDRMSIYPDTIRFVGCWPDDVQRLKWEAVHKSVQNEWESKAAEKSHEDAFEKYLAPIREVYDRTPYPRKQALLAAILYYITR